MNLYCFLALHLLVSIVVVTFAKHPERYYKLSVIISLGYRPCAVQVYIIIMYYLLNPLRLITTYYV